MLNLKELSKADKINFEVFTEISLDCIGIIEQSANKTFIITANIEVCRTEITGIFEDNKENKLSKNASYICQLDLVDPELFNMVYSINIAK